MEIRGSKYSLFENKEFWDEVNQVDYTKVVKTFHAISIFRKVLALKLHRDWVFIWKKKRVKIRQLNETNADSLKSSIK